MKGISKINIRKAVIADYEYINALHSSVNDLNALFAPFMLKHAEYTLKYDLFQEKLKNEKNFILIAEDNHKIAGFIIAEIRESLDKPALIKRKYMHVVHFGVGKEYRRRGIGTVLFLTCIDIARDKKCDDIEVTVMHKNKRAKAFYKSVGLEPIKNIYNYHLK